MIVTFGGTQAQRKYAESMAMFVCKKFNISPTVDINFKRMTNDTALGGCIELDDSEYEIEIKRNLPLREMLTTLAHEMVHVKQYELGELTQTNHSNYEYWDKPSEIEAHGCEVGLFITWAEQNNVAHKKWTQI